MKNLTKGYNVWIVVGLVAVIAGVLIFGGDSLAAQREATNQMQLHEMALTQRAAILAGATGLPVSKIVLPEPSAAWSVWSILSWLFSTVATAIAMIVLGGLAILAAAHYFRRPGTPERKMLPNRDMPRLTVVDDPLPMNFTKAKSTVAR